MTTVSTIILDAYRESNLIAITATPTSNESAEALKLLNRYIRWLTIRQKLWPLNYGQANVDTPDFVCDSKPDIDNSYVPENVRLTLNLESATTLNFPPNPQDGARIAIIDASSNLATYNVTINGNGRTIEGGLTATLNTNGLSREWFFRQDTGNWARLIDLEEDGVSPFPSEFDDLLVTGTAMRINPRNGVAADPQSGQTYQQSLSAFRARYFQVRQARSDEALLRLPSDWNYWRYYTDSIGFNRGYPRW